MGYDGDDPVFADATVLVVQGQRAGETMVQETPCDAWAYDGGFIFYDLTAGVEMTLRISASGYKDDERTVVPSAGSQMSILFTPSSNK